MQQIPSLSNDPVAQLYKAGLRPVHLWVPDTSRPEFRAQLEREAAALSTAREKEALDFIAAIAEFPD